MPFIVHWFMTACRGMRKSFQCHFFFQQSITGGPWGYATELWLFTLLVLRYFLKEHMARQQSGRLLSCPMLAGKAVAEKEFPSTPSAAGLTRSGETFQSQDVAGGAGGGGRAGREPAAQGQTTREQQVAAFCKEQTHRQASKAVGERELDARISLEPRSRKILLAGKTGLEERACLPPMGWL